MKIALVSFEYPPDTAFGGIGTYMQQWARLLQSRGHHVEVFGGSETRTTTEEIDGLIVHRTLEKERSKFKDAIIPIFSQRHEAMHFDLVESPEFNADAINIKKKYPEVNLVVKLHAPSFLVNRINGYKTDVPLKHKIHAIAKDILKLQKPQLYWRSREMVNKSEKTFTSMANIITSPSIALKQLISKEWRIADEHIHHLPNPYVPSESLLNIDSATNNNSQKLTITFIGRLDKLKGVLSFLYIIPKVVERYPNVHFQFIGGDSFIQPSGESARGILKKELSGYQQYFSFVDHVSLSEIPDYLAQADICVFPSFWENFPTVCLEAMSAGRAIVGSINGGMKDMLGDPEAGLLINPTEPQEIADAICKLIADPQLRIQLGRQARALVLERYNADVIGQRFEKIVARTI